MAGIRYAAYRKKQRGGRYVWGVLGMEGRRQQFHTVGPDGPESHARAKRLAARMRKMQESQRPAGHFLSWHRPGDPIPLDRAVRDHAHHHGSAVGTSTASRYRQFAERLALRLGDRDLSLLGEEDVAQFVEAEHTDGRAPDPTINACVFLNGTVLACTRARTPDGTPHLTAHPLPKLAGIAKRIRRRLWTPPLDADATPAWTIEEIQRLLDTAQRSFPDLYGVCFFQRHTGCRIGEVLALRWTAVDLDRGEIHLRLRIHQNKPGEVKTRASNRRIPISYPLIVFLKSHRETQQPSSPWIFPRPGDPDMHWDDRKFQQHWRALRESAGVRQLGTHAWRHAFISQALAHGWSPASVAAHVGCSVEVMLRRYAHAIPRAGGPSFDFIEDD